MDPYEQLETRHVEKGRYQEMKQTLAPLAESIRGKRVLDFGAGWGLSVFALLALGAREVVGVEPSKERVAFGNDLLSTVGVNGAMTHVSDTGDLPFGDREFEIVVANAVFEHIPQPRDRYVQEVWRVTDHELIINETPNKLFPKEVHTTKLWFLHWLPCEWAYRYAKWRGKAPSDDWYSSGWRGVGHWEIARNLPGHKFIGEQSRFRHRFLSTLGLPSTLIDPYPLWIFQRAEASPERVTSL